MYKKYKKYFFIDILTKYSYFDFCTSYKEKRKAEKNLPLYIIYIAQTLLCALAEHINLLFLKALPIALHNSVADLFHKLVIEIKVMDNAQAHTEQFACLEQMADIRTGIGLTNRTVAIRVDRSAVEKVFIVVKIHNTFTREEIAVSCVSRGHYAVEEINASVNRLEYVNGSADAHKVTRLIVRQIRLARFDNAIHFIGAFANSESADSVTGKVELCDLLKVTDTDILVNAALTDTEKKLVLIYRFGKRIKTVHFGFTAIEPASGSVDRFGDILMSCYR